MKNTMAMGVLALLLSSILAPPSWGAPPVGSRDLFQMGVLGLLKDQEEQFEGNQSIPEPVTGPFVDMYQDYLELSEEELGKLLDESPRVLPTGSLGKPQAGRLFNSIPLPPGKGYIIRRENRVYTTPEVSSYIQQAILKVHEEFPGSPDLFIGDISREQGGRLGKHLSHTSGVDMDISYYYMGEYKWYKVAHRNNLDRARTWALVRAFLTEGHVNMIFINRSIQRMLYKYAQFIGEDQEWLDEIFQYPEYRHTAIIRHSPGHHTHIHVRFQSPMAQEMGRRLYPLLIDRGIIRPLYGYFRYRVHRGDTMSSLARRFGTTVGVIKKINRSRSTRLYTGRKIKIPRPTGVASVMTVQDIKPKHSPPPPAHPELRDKYTRELMAQIERREKSKRGRKSSRKRRKGKILKRKVRKGDTLWSIARRFKVSPKDLKRWNRLKSDNLQPGQILKVRR